jgi:hypothetical protein
LVALAPTTASAQVPGVLPIQGYITDAEGVPYDAEVAIRFNLYDAPTGGTELYSERISVPVTSGVFTAYLGSVTALDMGMFREHTAVYLGIQIGADAEATPRLPFGTVPFAAVSDSTGSFGGVDADDFPTTVEEWALAACPDTVEELSAILDPIYANPAWDAITGVPADIADGDDGFTTEEELTALLDDNYANPAWDTITGVPADIADGDDGFTTEDELTALLNDNYRAGDWVPGWGDIVGIPAALADGDDDTTYTAGDGLTLDGTEFAVDFDGPGEATTAARSDGLEALEERVDGIEETMVTAPARAVYRWASFHTYDNNNGWIHDNDPTLFGGINPSVWTNSNAMAHSLSADMEVLRSLFVRTGHAGWNANVYTDTYLMYSSTTAKMTVALFRIRNTTGSAITWTPYFIYTSYSSWGERASVSINRESTWNSGSTNSGINNRASLNISIPAGRISTIVFVSGSDSELNISHDIHVRTTTLGFYNNSLRLPAGLEYVDDLDTATAWSQPID